MKKIVYVGLTLLICSLTTNAQVQLTVSDPSPLCVGGSALLTASGASSYVWSPATGLSATTGATVKATPAVTTVYSVTGTTDGNSSTKTITVAVNPNCNAVCHNTGGGASFNWVGLTHYYTGDNTEEDLIGDADLFHLNHEGFAPGKINSGFSLNGNVQEYKSTSNRFIPNGDFTVSLWLYSSTMTASKYFLNIEGVGGFLVDATRRIDIRLGSEAFYEGRAVLQPNTWYHILLIKKSGVRTTIYVNDFIDIESDNTGVYTYPASQILHVGGNGVGNFFEGVVDEVMFLNRAITEDERAALYNNGAGIQAPY